MTTFSIGAPKLPAFLNVRKKPATAFVCWLIILLAVLVAAAALWLQVTIKTHFTPIETGSNPAIDWRDMQAIDAVADAQPPQRTVRQGDTPSYAPVDYNPSDVLAPPKQFGPWAWWWWPGADIDLARMEEHLDLLEDMGFAGFEHEAFSVGTDLNTDKAIADRVLTVGTEEYYGKLRAVLAMLEERGMQVDLGESSGWPANGPHIPAARGLSDLSFVEMTVNGGGDVVKKLPKPKPIYADYMLLLGEVLGGGDLVNFTLEPGRFRAVTAAKAIGGKRSGNIFNLNDQVELDPESIIDLTDHVDADGVLRWDAPAGKWLVIGAYQRPSATLGSGVTSAYPRGGYLLDHFDASEVRRHLEYSFGADTGLSPHFGKAMRGLFVDSTEFPVSAHVSDDFFAEFEKRRGYRLEPLLPAIAVEGRHHFAAHTLGVNAKPSYVLTANDARIRHDYDLTISELFTERFLGELTDWANARNMEVAGEVYGLKLDTIRAMGRLDIPQTEQLYAGGTDLFLKLSSAAGALYGRPVIAAETFVSVGRDYAFTPRRLKAMADKAMLSGVNQIHYHGITYPWPNDTGAGEGLNWYPWSSPSSQFSGALSFTFNATPDNAFWPDLKPLNQYIARSHYLLRQGKPEFDLLVYYPFLGFHSVLEGEGFEKEHLFDAYLPDSDPASMHPFHENARTGGASKDDEVAWLNRVRQLTHKIDARGVTWNWFNSHALGANLVEAQRLPASGGTFDAIVVPFVAFMPAGDLRQLIALANDGVAVHFVGEPPASPPGYRNLDEEKRVIADLLSEARRHAGITFHADEKAFLSWMSSASPSKLAFTTNVPARRLGRRISENERIDFIASIANADQVLELDGDLGDDTWVFNPMTGEIAGLPVAENGRYALALEPFGSRFIVTGLERPEGAEKPRCAGANTAAGSMLQLEEWTLRSPSNNAELALTNLTDWREIDLMRYHDGPADYVVDIPSYAGGGACAILDLGLVQGAAEVYVNDEKVARLAYHPFKVDIADNLEPGANTVRVRLIPPQRNAFIGKAKAGDKAYKHFAERADGVVAAGLLGPVTLGYVPAGELAQ